MLMQDWVFADHADGYLLASAHYLARASTGPEVGLLPKPSVSATLFCAFAAEAYVNVALLRLLDEEEYRPLDRLPVRSKYYLCTRLGLREAWFAGGESVLEHLGDLMRQRNRLVHAQPELFGLNRDPETSPEPYEDLANVAKWISATANAVSRLGRAHGDLGEFGRVSDPLLEVDAVLDNFDPERHGNQIQRLVVTINRTLTSNDEKDFLEESDLDDLLGSLDPDWDLPPED